MQKLRQVIGVFLLLSILPIFTGIVANIANNNMIFMTNAGIVYLIEFGVIVFVLFVIFCINLIIKK